MDILHTPDDRFDNLPDYPFPPKYIEVGTGLKMHYIDEGPQNGQVVLLLHGEPSWSFLYRKMVPILVRNGFRVVAPDLIGFGRSSKPSKTQAYTYALHIQWAKTFVQKLGIHNITFFGQDWGGLIGLRLITAEPDKYNRIVVANTGLPTGDYPMSEAFLQWQKFSITSPVFPFKKIMQNSAVSELSSEVLEAYVAPFPNDDYIAGARIFPSLVPTRPDDPESENNRQAWKILRQWEKPCLTLFSDADPITKGGEVVFQKLVPGANGQKHTTIKGAGHFLQEDKGEEIAQHIVDFIKST